MPRKTSLCLILVLCAVLPAVFPVPSAANSAVIGEVRSLSGVKVDGRLTEWRGVSQIRLDQASQIIAGIGRWGGPADASGRIVVAYDQRHLYVAGEIRDDKLVNDQSGILMWNGDCVQVFISPADPANPNRSYQQTDLHFGISPGGDGSRPEWVLWQPAGKRVSLQLGLVRTADGYSFEVAIPLDQIGLNPEPGKTFGFGVALTDADEPRVVKSQLSTAPANAWQNPALLSKAVFR